MAVFDDLIIETVVDDLVEQYEAAQTYEFIGNPLSYALYQVWKKYDKRENKFLHNERNIGGE